MLAAVAVGAGVLLFLLTRDRRYLSFSFRVFKWSVLSALIVVAMLMLERLITLV